MKRKQVTAACLMAATMLFSGCTPNISEYAARAQQAGKSFWEGETTDAMAQDSDAAATADDETSVAGETQNVSTGTGTAAATDDKVQDSAAATDDEIQGGITATGGEAQHGDTAATADSEMPATGETQTDTATESAAATAPQIPALMTEVTDSVYEAYAQKSDVFTGKLAGHDRLSRAENAALTAVLSQKEYGDKTLCLQNMAKYDSNANESFLLMFESTPLTARGRISGDLWYYDGESARLLEKGIVVTGLQQVTGIGYSGNGSLRQKTGGCLDGKRSKVRKASGGCRDDRSDKGRRLYVLSCGEDCVRSACFGMGQCRRDGSCLL